MFFRYAKLDRIKVNRQEGMAMELQKNDLIVFEGDSLTRREMGWSRDTWPFLRLMNWDNSWAEKLAEWLFCWRPDLCLSFKHAAVGGSNSRGIKERLPGVLELKPNWVILTIGNNDPFQGVSLEEFEKNINEYVKQLNEVDCKVLFLGGFRPMPGLEEGNNDKYHIKKKYHQKLKEIADATGNYYLDIGQGLYRRAVTLYEQCDLHSVYGDGTHFNNVGNTIMAGLVLQAFGITNIKE